MRSVLLLSLALGCGTPEDPTWHADIRPIFEAHCLSCHDEGGIAPFVMDLEAEGWEERVPAWLPRALDAVEAGTMPPWMPSDDCLPLQGSRRLPEADRSRVLRWGAGDMALGDPADHVAPEPPPSSDLGQPDLLLASAEAYTADPERPDDYRCFVLDADFPEDAWVRALDVRPDRAELVHHVLLYRISPDEAPAVVALDEASDGVGYTCFGGPGTQQADTLAGWAPGQLPEVYTEGVARRIDAGSRLVLQVHYNLLNLPSGAPVPADQTRLALWTLPPGERPERQLISQPLANGGIDLPAGASEVVERKTFPYTTVPDGIEVIGVGPHMHQLGRSIRLDRIRGAEHTCLLDIPAWDFNWQQSYFFPEEAWQPLLSGDRFRLTCVYDNSAANQPVVNGVQQEPRRVRWGDGTLDEMCLLYAYVLVPPGLLQTP